MADLVPSASHWTGSSRPWLAASIVLLLALAPQGRADAATIHRTLVITPDQVHIDAQTGIATYNLADGRTIAGTQMDPFPDVPVSFDLMRGSSLDSLMVLLGPWSVLQAGDEDVTVNRRPGADRAVPAGEWRPGLGAEMTQEDAAHNLSHVQIFVRPLQRNTSDGSILLFTPIDISMTASGVLAVPVTPDPTDFRLEFAGANPSMGGSRIRYFVPKLAAQSGGELTLNVFDVSGRLVRTLERGPAAQGWNVVTWDGRDRNGLTVGSGAFFCRLQCGTKTLVLRLVRTE